MSTFIAALSLSATLLAATPEAGNGSAGDLARLQGCWTGEAGPKHDFRVTLRIEGQAARVTIVTPKGLTIRAKGEIRIDDTVSPHALDWVHFKSVNAQELPEVLAIYELAGDTFRVCNGGPDNDRPTEFKPGDGLLAEIVIFQRAAEGTERPSTKTAARP